MKWYKHDSNAHLDAKLQDVLLDYGLEGYGLYWYCLELITNRVDKDNVKFNLEHDSRMIARNTGSTPTKVSEMMKYFVTLGLFEDTSGVITCLKLAKRLDKSMSSNKEMRTIIANLRGNDHDEIKNSHDSVMMESGIVMQEENRLEEIRLEKNNNHDVVTGVHAQDSDKQNPCQYEKIKSEYNRVLSERPQVEILSDARKTKLRSIWNMNKDFQTVQFWTDFFEYVKQSDFLMGRSNSDYKGCDFDFLLQKSKFIKTYEGGYHQ